MKNFLSKIFKKKAAAPPAAPAPKINPPAVVLREEPGSANVVFTNLVLHGPDGAPLVDYGSYTIQPGDRVMIAGAAGCGKSAALAAMRNAWLLGGSGEITVPPEIRFVPQEEYFPDRSLRGIICAPDSPSKYTREQVVQALTDAGLADFVDAMDDVTKRGEYWKNTLSGGQKNKVGFAGIFLHAAETKVLIVDEITAALDAKSETELYPRLLDRMKHGIVISVAHHSTLAPQHNVFAKVAEGKVTYTKTADAKPAPANTNDVPAAPPKIA
ncbi:MAG: ATP-binding cassette domain-containing protein [bacterium]|nr:ATP-binding cassette domain-containing protein [bacterium]